MTRPLRHRHRWMIPALFLLLLAVSLLAITRPAPSARVDALPSAVVDAERGADSR